MEYQHTVKKARNISIHDCRCNQVVMDDHTITFIMKDGFYLTETAKTDKKGKKSAEDSKNVFAEPVRTGSAQITYKILEDGFDGVTVFTFSEVSKKHADRKLWDTDKFIEKVNSGKYEIEFVNVMMNKDSREILLGGYAWMKKKPYAKECYILIETSGAVYSWNDAEQEL